MPLYFNSRPGVDQTDELQAILYKAGETGDTVILRDGTYNITTVSSKTDEHLALDERPSGPYDLIIPQGVTLESENPGGAEIIGSKEFTTDAHPTRISFGAGKGGDHETTVDGFVFENIRMVSYNLGHNNSLDVQNNAFVDTLGGSSLSLNRHGDYLVEDNVFLASPKTLEVVDAYGKGQTGHSSMGTYSTDQLTIRGNMFGGMNKDFNYADVLDADVIKLAETAAAATGVDLHDANYLNKGIRFNQTSDTVLEGNTFYGDDAANGRATSSEESGSVPLKYDHAIYATNFDGLQVNDNYFNGWPANGTGGVKIRGGKDLDFHDNILDEVQFMGVILLSKARDSDAAKMYNKAENWNIHNNDISSKSKIAAIGFYERSVDESIRDTSKTDPYSFTDNMRIFDNKIDIENAPEGTKSIYMLISETPGVARDEFGHAVVTGNVDADGNPVDFSYDSSHDVTISRKPDDFIKDLREARAPEEDPKDEDPKDEDMTLVGTKGVDDLAGGNGNDSISGLKGSDTLFGNDGEDVLRGGRGHDLMYGGQNNDSIYAGKGNDTLFGDAGDDLLHGRRDDDLIDGGKGADTLYGGEGNDTLFGGKGNGSDYIVGGDGDDTIDGGDGIDIAAFSGNSDDYIFELNQDDGMLWVSDGLNTDKLSNIETLRFDDTDIDIISGKEAQKLIDSEGKDHIERSAEDKREMSEVTEEEDSAASMPASKATQEMDETSEEEDSAVSMREFDAAPQESEPNDDMSLIEKVMAYINELLGGSESGSGAQELSDWEPSVEESCIAIQNLFNQPLKDMPEDEDEEETGLAMADLI
jgi:Ca2+-binding RTX toxin-like protein